MLASWLGLLGDWLALASLAAIAARVVGQKYEGVRQGSLGGGVSREGINLFNGHLAHCINTF